MDEKRPFPNRENFIIRLWQRDSDPTTWVGQVQHVGSGETAAVHNLDELTAVVETMLVGQTLTYTMVLTNNGPLGAAGVMLYDTLPAGGQAASFISDEFFV